MAGLETNVGEEVSYINLNVVKEKKKIGIILLSSISPAIAVLCVMPTFNTFPRSTCYI